MGDRLILRSRNVPIRKYSRKLQSWLNSWLPNYFQIHTGKQKDALRFGEMVESSLSSNNNFAKRASELINLAYSDKDVVVGTNLESFVERFKLHWIARQRKTEELKLLKQFLTLDYSKSKLTSSNEQNKLIEANNEQASKNRMALSKLLSQKYSTESIKNIGEAKEFLEDRINQIYDSEKKQIKILPRDTNKESPYMAELNDLNALFNGFYKEMYLKATLNVDAKLTRHEGWAKHDYLTFTDYTINRFFKKDKSLDKKVKNGVNKVKSGLKQLKLDAELIHVLTFPYKTSDDIQDIISDFSKNETTKKLVERQINAEGYSSIDSYLTEIREPMHKKVKNRIGKLGLFALAIGAIINAEKIWNKGADLYHYMTSREQINQVISKEPVKDESQKIIKAPQIALMQYDAEFIGNDFRLKKENIANYDYLNKLDEKYFKQYEDNFRKFVVDFVKPSVKESLDEKIEKRLQGNEAGLFWSQEEEKYSKKVFDSIANSIRDREHLAYSTNKKLMEKFYLGFLHFELWTMLKDHEKKSGERLDSQEIGSKILKEDYKKTKEFKKFLSDLFLYQNAPKVNVDLSRYDNQKFVNFDDLINAHILSNEYLVSGKNFKDHQYGYDVLIIKENENSYITKPIFRFDEILLGNKKPAYKLEEEITRFAKSEYPYIEMSRGFDSDNAEAIMNLAANGTDEDRDFLDKYNMILKLNYRAWLESQAFMNEPFKSMDLVNDPQAWINLKKNHDHHFMNVELRPYIWNIEEAVKWENKDYITHINEEHWHNKYLEWMKPFIKEGTKTIVKKETASYNWLHWSSITSIYEGVKGTHISLNPPEFGLNKKGRVNRVYRKKIKKIIPKYIEYDPSIKLKEIFPEGYYLVNSMKSHPQLEEKAISLGLKDQILKLQKENFQRLKHCMEQVGSKVSNLNHHTTYYIPDTKYDLASTFFYICEYDNKKIITHNFLDNFKRDVELTE